MRHWDGISRVNVFQFQIPSMNLRFQDAKRRLGSLILFCAHQNLFLSCCNRRACHCCRGRIVNNLPSPEIHGDHWETAGRILRAPYQPATTALGRTGGSERAPGRRGIRSRQTSPRGAQHQRPRYLRRTGNHATRLRTNQSSSYAGIAFRPDGSEIGRAKHRAMAAILCSSLPYRPSASQGQGERSLFPITPCRAASHLARMESASTWRSAVLMASPCSMPKHRS
jgi:hypothetical protein